MLLCDDYQSRMMTGFLGLNDLDLAHGSCFMVIRVQMQRSPMIFGIDDQDVRDHGQGRSPRDSNDKKRRLSYSHLDTSLLFTS